MTSRTTNNTIREIADFLRTLDRVAVTTHVGADGDAIGTSAALVRLMRHLGAEAVFCHAEEVQGYLRWLLPDEPLTEMPPDHDLLVVDTSRPDRTGVPIPDAGGAPEPRPSRRQPVLRRIQPGQPEGFSHG